MPIGTSFSQISDTEPTLGITLSSFTPYNFKDEDGTTVILGEVQNTKNFPVTGIKIWAGFYDDIRTQPLESTIGTTVLDVIPPLGKSPYMIRSPTANSATTSVSVNLLGFNSSPPKQNWLEIEPGTIDVGENLTLSGNISNVGPVNTGKVRIHLISYDAFIPPRVLGVQTIEIEGELEAGKTQDFEFVTKSDPRTMSYKLVAQSDNFQSSFIEMQAPSTSSLKRLVTINDISLIDSQGNSISDIFLDSTINIQSKIWIQYSTNEEKTTQPYVYYVQIKESETGQVEYIGKSEGNFETGGTQIPAVEWTPEKKGLYFAETFVWDQNAIPLGSKGPLSLLLVT